MTALNVAPTLLYDPLQLWLEKCSNDHLRRKHSQPLRVDPLLELLQVWDASAATDSPAKWVPGHKVRGLRSGECAGSCTLRRSSPPPLTSSILSLRKACVAFTVCAVAPSWNMTLWGWIPSTSSHLKKSSMAAMNVLEVSVCPCSKMWNHVRPSETKTPRTVSPSPQGTSSSRRSTLCPTVSPATAAAECVLLVTCLWSCFCAWTRCLWPAACPRMGRRALSLACGTGEWVATSTENFSKFHQEKVVKNVKIHSILAQTSCQLTIL